MSCAPPDRALPKRTPCDSVNEPTCAILVSDGPDSMWDAMSVINPGVHLHVFACVHDLSQDPPITDLRDNFAKCPGPVALLVMLPELSLLHQRLHRPHVHSHAAITSLDELHSWVSRSRLGLCSNLYVAIPVRASLHGQDPPQDALPTWQVFKHGTHEVRDARRPGPSPHLSAPARVRTAPRPLPMAASPATRNAASGVPGYPGQLLRVL